MKFAFHQKLTAAGICPADGYERTPAPDHHLQASFYPLESNVSF